MNDPGDAAPPPPRRFDPTRLAAARLIAADTYPFLAVALFALTPVPSPGTGTFGVDEKWRLYIDPEALDRWTPQECAGVLLHEVSHVVRDHAVRARLASVDEHTHLLWNLAADAEINDDLRSDAIELPDQGIFPETISEPTGKAAEYYFAHLLDRAPEDLPDPPGCGSGCHGVSPEAGEGEAFSGAVDLSDAPGLEPAEAMLLRLRVAEAVVELGRSPGNIGGGWTRWATGLLDPQLDWRMLLHGALRRAVGAVSGAVDYSYRRPSRRRVPGVVLPSLVQPLPRAAVIIDTSASMSDEMLDVAWTEVRGCLRSLGVRRDFLTVYAGDVDVERVKATTSRRVALTGGGGTDMATAIDTVSNQRPRPDLIVVLTDGYTPWPDRPPASRVVIALLDDELETLPTPTWAKVVRITPDDVVRAL